jgi:restriction system protein
VARQSKKNARAARRQGEAAIKLMVVGTALALVPLFLNKSPFGKAFAALTPVGLLMLAAGALLMWLGRRNGQASGPQVSAKTTDLPQRPVRRAAAQLAPTAPNQTDVDVDATAPKSAAAVEPLRPQGWGKAAFDVIEWRRFEAVVERLFQQAGFETESQSHGADEGVDVWLYSRNQPGEPVSLVQCKHWQGKRVGVDKIRELRGVMAARNVKRGQFATTSTFTPDAIAFARENGINLLDVDGLLGLIGKRNPDEQAELLAVALDGDYWRPTCVNCGVKMVGRAPRKGGSAFWGCSNYPKCKTTMPMRAN